MARKVAILLYYVKSRFKLLIFSCIRLFHFLRLFIHYRIILSSKSVGLGTIFHTEGGVANHILAASKYMTTTNMTVPCTSLNYNLDTETFKEWCSRYKLISNKIVHSHVDPWFIEVCESAQGQGSRWIHTYHTLYFEKDWDNGLQDWQIAINTTLIEKAKQADVKIAVAYWLKAHLKQHYNIDTMYVPNGVDVQKCDRADAERFASKYGLKDFILFASGISDIKNAGMFLKLANAMPEQAFVIIGRDITKQRLQDKFQVPLGPNLTIFGAMPHVDLLDAIAACRVFVVTSRSEGLPTVLMEAMALERSVVGVASFGTGEVIHSEDYGYLYEPDNLDDLIAKTQQAYKHSKGQEARQRILKEYDWRIVAPQLDEIYLKLLRP